MTSTYANRSRVPRWRRDLSVDRCWFVRNVRGGNGAPGKIRTCGLCLRRAALYPLSYERTTSNSEPTGDGAEGET